MLLDILPFLLATLAAAVPLQKRTLSSTGLSALDLALYFENLEYALYTGGCNNYTDANYTAAGFPSNFRDSVCTIAQHEATHIAAISSILAANGAPVNPPCTYQFLYYPQATWFVDLAISITNIGIGAYLGGSSLLTDNADLEEVAASILTVEARHDTFLNAGLTVAFQSMGPDFRASSPFPDAFDTGLTATWAFNLAQTYVVSCPTQLPYVQLPKLKILHWLENDPSVPSPGVLTQFSWDPSELPVTVNLSTPLYIAFVSHNTSAPLFLPLNRTSAPFLPLTILPDKGSAIMPNLTGAGAAFACLTTFSGGLDLAALSSYGTLAGPTVVTAI